MTVRAVEGVETHNEGVETITTSEATCDKRCQKKHARGVSEQARGLSKSCQGYM